MKKISDLIALLNKIKDSAGDKHISIKTLSENEQGHQTIHFHEIEGVTISEFEGVNLCTFEDD